MNLHYYIGKLSKRYRLWYWRTHENHWLWGMMRFIHEAPESTFELSEDDIDKSAFSLSDFELLAEYFKENTK